MLLSNLDITILDELLTQRLIVSLDERDNFYHKIFVDHFYSFTLKHTVYGPYRYSNQQLRLLLNRKY